MTSTHNDKIERMCADLGCTGKRVSKELIESRITQVDYQTVEIAGQKMMFCGIRMDNGFVALGDPSVCIDPANWREEIGRTISYENSFKKLWALEAYRLMSGAVVDVLALAKKCHEMNRTYCRALGDFSQLAWEDAPEWQRVSAIKGVEFHMANPDAGPDASHRSWLAQKQREGWVYGPEKSAEKKEHPCIVPFEQLPAAQQAKDYLFKQVVDSEMGRGA